MSTKGRKRRATDSAAAAAGSHVPYTQAVRLQRHFQGPAGVTIGTAVQQAQKADAEFGESWTPYGTLVKEIDLEYKEGDETLRVEYLCPRALMYLLCQQGPAFAQFLAKHVGLQVLGEAWPSRDALAKARAGRVVIYGDEVRPGNVHRPDTARLYTGIYWTLMELPDWFRNSQAAWFPLCYLRATAVQQFEAGLSQVMVSLLEAMWSPVEGGENLAREGLRVPLAEEPLAFLHFRLTFASWLGDEKFLKEVTCAMGASGVKMCFCCMNAVGSKRFRSPAEIPAGSTLVHFSEPRAARFKPHTLASLRTVAEHLEEMSHTATRTQLGILETNIGFNYAPKGLLWSRMSDLARFPESAYWDSQHVLFASGGVAQRELNQLLRRVSRLYPLADIDRVLKTIVFPRAFGKRLNMRLAQRVVNTDKAGARTFASETIALLAGMVAVCVELLEPRAQLLEEVACLKLMAEISGLLRQGDAVVRSLPRLRRAIEEHNVRFVLIYLAIVTPKLHYLGHIPDCIARFLAAFNCFAPEHKHRVSKGIAAFAYKRFTKTMTVRAARQQFEALGAADVLAPFALEGAKPRALTPEQVGLFLRSGLPLPPLPDMVVSGKHLKTPRGRISVGDFAVFREEGGHVGRGFALAFFRLRAATGAQTFYAHVSACARLHGEARHMAPPEGVTPKLVEGDLLFGACPYYRKGDALHALEADRVPAV